MRYSLDFIEDAMEVYINGMIIKSLKEDDHLDHLSTSKSCEKYIYMKLNPTKCSFKVTFGRFLGYLVTKSDIEADPKQIKAIENIQNPINIKEVQKLIVRLATQNILHIEVLKQNPSLLQHTP